MIFHPQGVKANIQRRLTLQHSFINSSMLNPKTTGHQINRKDKTTESIRESSRFLADPYHNPDS